MSRYRALSITQTASRGQHTPASLHEASKHQRLFTRPACTSVSSRGQHAPASLHEASMHQRLFTRPSIHQRLFTRPAYTSVSSRGQHTPACVIVWWWKTTASVKRPSEPMTRSRSLRFLHVYLGCRMNHQTVDTHWISCLFIVIHSWYYSTKNISISLFHWVYVDKYLWHHVTKVTRSSFIFTCSIYGAYLM